VRFRLDLLGQSIQGRVGELNDALHAGIARLFGVILGLVIIIVKLCKESGMLEAVHVRYSIRYCMVIHNPLAPVDFGR